MSFSLVGLLLCAFVPGGSVLDSVSIACRAIAEQVARQDKAVATLEKIGCGIRWKTRGPVWLHRLARPDTFHFLDTVDAVDVNWRAPISDQVASVVDDGAMVSVAQLPDLEYLRLDHSLFGVGNHPDVRITDAGMRELRALIRLRELSVRGNDITDRGLESLAPLKNLCVLDISGTSVTDSGIRFLVQLPSLRLLRVSTTLITPEGIRRLRGALPHAVIQY
jgi:hypothetical protein